MKNLDILNKILQEIQNLESVEAIAIGGSKSAKTYDNKSDIDVYVFTPKDIPVTKRENLIKNIHQNMKQEASISVREMNFLLAN